MSLFRDEGTSSSQTGKNDFSGILGGVSNTVGESVVRDCYVRAKRYSSEKLPQYFQSLDAALFELAENARSNQEQSNIYDCLRVFREQKTVVEAHFGDVLKQGFEKFMQGESLDYIGSSDAEDGNLAILQNDDLEESIAISSIGRKAEIHYNDSLYGIKQRLSVLRGGEKVSHEDNPLGPRYLCYCLRGALSCVEFDINSKIAAYKVYAKEFVFALDQFYEDTNSFLISRNILPHLRPETESKRNASAKPQGKTAKQDNSTAKSQSRPEQQLAESVAKSADIIKGKLREISSDIESVTQQRRLSKTTQAQSDAYPQLMASLEQLQGQLQKQPKGALSKHIADIDPGGYGQFLDADSSGSTIPEFPTDDIVNVLNGLQDQAAELRLAYTPKAVWEPIQREYLRHQLKDQLIQTGVEAKKIIPSTDLNMIDLVGMLFDYMLDDTAVPDSVKALLCHLHTPYLKIALVDKSLFREMQHPARLLLERLCEAGAELVGTHSSKEHEVYDKIDKVVTRILKEYKGDIALFDELLAEFTDFISKLRRRAEILERRAIEKARGEDKLREVKKLAYVEIQERIKDNPLPKEMSLLLLQPWSDYLTFILLRYGDSSGAWTQALTAVDDLIWSLKPKKTRSEKSRLSELMPELEVTILRGLETIGYDKSLSQELIEKMGEYQKLVFDGQDFSSTDGAAIAAEELDSNTVEVQLEDLSDHEKEILEQLYRMEFGTQFIFHKSVMGRSAKLKLAWFNDNTQNYMFVDQLGKKVAVKSAAELARSVAKKEIEVVENDNKPLVERALESIFKKVTKTIENVKEKH